MTDDGRPRYPRSALNQPPETTQAPNILISSSGAVVLVAIAIFLVNLIRAPALIAHDDRAAKEAAEAERDAARKALGERSNRIVVWLGERLREVLALQRELVDVAMDVDAFDRIGALKDSLNALNDRVVAELRLAGPQWVDYYLTDPDWHNPDVQLLGEADRQHLDRVLDYTTLQLIHIQEGLRSAESSSAGSA